MGDVSPIVASIIAGGAGMTAIMKYLGSGNDALIRELRASAARSEKRITQLEIDHKLCIAQHTESERKLGELIGEMREIQRKMGNGK